MGGPIDMKQKENTLAGYWINYVTLILILTSLTQFIYIYIYIYTCHRREGYLSGMLLYTVHCPPG